MTPEILQHHLDYQHWAIDQILQAVHVLSTEEYLKDRGSSHHGIHGTLVHMFRADKIWLLRVTGNPQPKMSEIPEPQSLAELQAAWKDVQQRWKTWADARRDDQWDEKIFYAQMDGTEHHTPAWQIVLHLVNHSTMHRGQVVTMLRQAGVKPPLTDLIFFYRTLEKERAVAR